MLNTMHSSPSVSDNAARIMYRYVQVLLAETELQVTYVPGTTHCIIDGAYMYVTEHGNVTTPFAAPFRAREIARELNEF